MLTYKEYFEEISFMNKLEDAVKAGTTKEKIFKQKEK